MRDRSLDEFVTQEGETEQADDTVTETVPSGADTPIVEPAESTYAWSPDGDACAACGAVVERRWRDSDGLVCETCKTW